MKSTPAISRVLRWIHTFKFLDVVSFVRLLLREHKLFALRRLKHFHHVKLFPNPFSLCIGQADHERTALIRFVSFIQSDARSRVGFVFPVVQSIQSGEQVTVKPHVRGRREIDGLELRRRLVLVVLFRWFPVGDRVHHFEGGCCAEQNEEVWGKNEANA